MVSVADASVRIEFAEITRERESVLVQFGDAGPRPVRIRIGKHARTISDDEVLAMLSWLQRLRARAEEGRDG